MHALDLKEVILIFLFTIKIIDNANNIVYT